MALVVGITRDMISAQVTITFNLDNAGDKALFQCLTCGTWKGEMSLVAFIKRGIELGYISHQCEPKP